jgi:hypothetical protein
MTTTKIPTELQIYGFRKFLWNHVSLLFQVWGVSSNAFLISLVGCRSFAALAFFSFFPKHISGCKLFFFFLNFYCSSSHTGIFSTSHVSSENFNVQNASTLTFYVIFSYLSPRSPSISVSTSHGYGTVIK